MVARSGWVAMSCGCHPSTALRISVAAIPVDGCRHVRPVDGRPGRCLRIAGGGRSSRAMSASPSADRWRRSGWRWADAQPDEGPLSTPRCGFAVRVSKHHQTRASLCSVARPQVAIDARLSGHDAAWSAGAWSAAVPAAGDSGAAAGSGRTVNTSILPWVNHHAARFMCSGVRPRFGQQRRVSD